MSSEEPFSGSIADRLDGLEEVLDVCAEKKVLDLGCSLGIVAHEFANRGATMIHGIDSDPFAIGFARHLFRFHKMESSFVECNFVRQSDILKSTDFAESYEIVLFLGLYHHIKPLMNKEGCEIFLENLVEAASDWLVVRTPLLEELDAFFLMRGFYLHSRSEGKNGTGPLHVYRKARSK